MSWQDNLRVSASFFPLCHFKNKKVQLGLHLNAHLSKCKLYYVLFDKNYCTQAHISS